MQLKPENSAPNLEAAKAIIDFLRDECGVQCAITGGYARDAFFGIAPKDIDIQCFGIFDREKAKAAVFFGSEATNLTYRQSYADGLSEDELLRAAVAAICYRFKPDGGFSVQETFGVYHTKKETDDEFIEGHKFDCGIDVLVYEPVATLFDAVNRYDYNLSQFALVGPELIPEYLGESDLRVLKEVRDDMEYARRVYMREKHASMLPLIEQAYYEGRL